MQTVELLSSRTTRLIMCFLRVVLLQLL